MEQHGPHLPVCVDTAIADAIVAASLPHLKSMGDLPALFLPTQMVGFSPEHTAFAGTLSLKAETVLRLWMDIGESIAATGIKKLLIFNSHGGQVGIADIVARDLRARFGMQVFRCNWFDLPIPMSDFCSPHEQRFGIHAGEVETALMLAIAPELVRMERALVFHSTSEDRAARYPILGNGKSAKLGWMMQDYNPSGAVGNAAAATAEMGRAVIEASGKALAQLLAEFHALPDNPAP
jgi:creatinine amidohydrolase